jgi:hypothetical protein
LNIDIIFFDFSHSEIHLEKFGKNRINLYSVKMTFLTGYAGVLEPPTYWMWIVGPSALYIIERIIRIVRGNQETILQLAVGHPSKVGSIYNDEFILILFYFLELHQNVHAIFFVVAQLLLCIIL